MTSSQPTSAPLAVALLSGGLDSCVAAAVAALDHRLALLHVGYGQRTEARELQAFSEIADHLGAAMRLVCRFPHLQQIGGTALISGHGQKQHTDAELPDTYVPFRNGNLLAAAVSYAEVVDAAAIFVGAHEADSPYPDCTASFFNSFAAAVAAGTGPSSEIRICTPLLHLDKTAIVSRGHELGAPLHLTWSCYTASEIACGRCESCRIQFPTPDCVTSSLPLYYLDRP